MARPNKGKGKGKGKGKSGPLQRRARQDVRLSYRPLLQENQRMQNAADSVYGALPGEIKDIGQGYTGKIDNISDLLTQNAGDVAGVFPTLGAPASEVGAFQGAYGDALTGALGNLSSMAGRQAGYTASGLREAGLAGRSAQDTLMQQRGQIMDNMPADIRQRVSELREEALTRQLAKGQMEGDEAFSQYLIDMVGGQLNRDNRRDNRRRNNKPKGKGNK
jgi:hypothetical protein